MVWDYVGELKSSVSKELCLIRFHPLTEEDEVAYDSLYSYFSSRGRFGVVPNKTRHIKNLYLIPLGAKDPIPSALLPFEGPGKHQLSGWQLRACDTHTYSPLTWSPAELGSCTGPSTSWACVGGWNPSPPAWPRHRLEATLNTWQGIGSCQLFRIKFPQKN
ncbi:PREDICTED: death-inducer obliterator 1-like [Galeopterus variegatus]|uniref:Death-inducer obliterator 1-like n=1 Tax=Galeopterus variegatus TaxID=482537 RepID=A0ABM0S550_GALVR|nr:PREDICTED: death-inducer obliterator 1-like [Galeopterus variegatus]